MTCMGHCEIKPHVYEKFVEKIKCLRTTGMLEK